MTPKENAKGKIPLQLGDAKTFAAQSVCLVSSRSGVPPPHTHTPTPQMLTRCPPRHLLRPCSERRRRSLVAGEKRLGEAVHWGSFVDRPRTRSSAYRPHLLHLAMEHGRGSTAVGPRIELHVRRPQPRSPPPIEAAASDAAECHLCTRFAAPRPLWSFRPCVESSVAGAATSRTCELLRSCVPRFAPTGEPAPAPWW
jgi:hypothetical protein